MKYADPSARPALSSYCSYLCSVACSRLREYTKPPAKLSCSPTAPFSPARSTQFSFRSNFS